MSIKGINTRLSLALLLLILVTVGSLGGYLLWRTHDHTVQLLTNSLTLQALTTRQYIEKDLVQKIKNGFPQTLMPKYDFLSLYELHQIARYLKSPL